MLPGHFTPSLPARRGWGAPSKSPPGNSSQASGVPGSCGPGRLPLPSRSRSRGRGRAGRGRCGCRGPSAIAGYWERLAAAARRRVPAGSRRISRGKARGQREPARRWPPPRPGPARRLRGTSPRPFSSGGRRWRPATPGSAAQRPGGGAGGEPRRPGRAPPRLRPRPEAAAAERGGRATSAAGSLPACPAVAGRR